WIQDKLGNLANFSKGKGYSKNDLVSSGFQILLYGSLYTNYKIEISETNTYVSDDTGAVKSKGHEVVVPSSGETPDEIARASAITSKDIIIGGDLNIVLPPFQLNSIFLAVVLTFGKSQKELRKRAQGATITHLRNSDLTHVLVSYPTRKEQDIITLFLKRLDKIITLEQKKIEKLELLKQYLLQNMFADKSGYPKIRFTNFNNEWSQDKLEDVADVRDGTHDSPKYLSEGVPLITSKNVGNGKINYNDINYISLDDYKKINNRSKVDINDILMGMIGTIGNLALIHTEPAFAIKNVALIKDTQQIFYLFLYYYLHCPFITKQLRINLDGGTQKFISLKKIRNLLIRTTNSVEQEKIGNCFNTLDSLITLEKTKLDKIQILKQKFLSSLFI
ncbi:restriction endonuclease subunit S, partial [Aerococcus urinae]